MAIHAICLSVSFPTTEYLKIVFISERYKNYVTILIPCFILVPDDGSEITHVPKHFTAH